MNIVLTVRGATKGRVRELSFEEEVSAAILRKGKVAKAVVWPVPVPEYGKDDAAKARRTRYYFDAVAEAGSLRQYLAGGIASGHTITVRVETGAVMTGDKDKGIYANVVAPELLASIANFDGVKVEVQAGADDPRDYVSEE